MEDKRKCRSSRYQYKINEIPVLDAIIDGNPTELGMAIVGTYGITETTAEILDQMKELDLQLGKTMRSMMHRRAPPIVATIYERLCAGRTQSEIAKELNVTQGTILRNIHDTCNPGRGSGKNSIKNIIKDNIPKDQSACDLIYKIWKLQDKYDLIVYLAYYNTARLSWGSFAAFENAMRKNQQIYG